MSHQWDRSIEQSFTAAIDLHREFLSKGVGAVVSATTVIAAAIGSGGKLLVCGNGGSAADAQHVAAELVGRFQRNRRALPAIALTADTSILTSISNDLSFEEVFARQVEAIGTPKDVLLAISTSGGSRNVVRAIETAKQLSMKTVALTANDGGVAGAAADVHVNVATQSTARAQEVHRTILHVLCELLEQELAGA